ncbi:MAG: RNA-binding protein [Candidatus Xiphinematobacter sp.]|nr:MAG: RNA-binding protein [Candidatus Xiphinematobacter sp.]
MNKRLYVGNLSYDTSEDKLRAAFEKFGTVTDVKIMQDRNTSQPRGFGFVTMSTQSEGEAAINGLNGADLDGRNLTVNEARPLENRSPSGGGNARRFSKSRRF